MKERIHLKYMPPKSVIEEFLEGLDGQPTIIFNREEMRFERADNPNLLCIWCGKPMETKQSSYYCDDCHLWIPKK